MASGFAALSENIFLLRGVDVTGDDAWYVLGVARAKLPLFQEKCRALESVNLEAFGEILESGYGEEPPYEVVERYRNASVIL